MSFEYNLNYVFRGPTATKVLLHTLRKILQKQTILEDTQGLRLRTGWTI